MPTNQTEGQVSTLGKVMALIDKYTLIAITMWMCYRDWNLERDYRAREIVRETFYQSQITKAIDTKKYEYKQKIDSLNSKFPTNDTAKE